MVTTVPRAFHSPYAASSYLNEKIIFHPMPCGIFHFTEAEKSNESMKIEDVKKLISSEEKHLLEHFS